MNYQLLWKSAIFSVSSMMAMSAVQAAPLNVMTEDYPPFNMQGEGGKIVGLSTEVVEELFKRAGVEYKLTLMPWKRAYEDTLGTPNTALYSTTRTPEREALFKWVGPLVNNNWVFFSSSTANITVSSLDDAKQYSVGGYNGDAAAEYLKAQGFTKLQLAANDTANVKKTGGRPHRSLGYRPVSGPLSGQQGESRQSQAGLRVQGNPDEFGV